jgi:4-diphosphocytidyl-2C-methyl-D-erythritol kinase
LFNDLAEPAMTVAPALKDLHQRVEQAVGLPIHVTGSGSTLFILCEPSNQTLQAIRESARDATVIPARLI